MAMGSQKQLHSIRPQAPGHWVGDGFPVRTLFSYADAGAPVSPFLLLDHAGPVEFPPTVARRGVEEHPHRGFETVTIVYAGEVEHRDSSGGGGRIGPGDVQWMTAGSGILHEEFHGADFARRGGRFEMIQLWVNLPARHKMTKPRYQGIAKDRIPTRELPGGAGTMRVIAGNYRGTRGPADTFTPVFVWDLQLIAHHRIDIPVPDGYSTLLVVRAGRVRAGGSDHIEEGGVALFTPAGTFVQLEGAEDSSALLLGGEPIDEPIVARGPFVMNTEAEIRHAMADYRSGKMGNLR